MTKTRIAVIVSLLFAAPAAVVALEQSASIDAAEPRQELQATTPEVVVATEPPLEILVVAEPVVITETVIVAEVPAAEPVRQPVVRTHTAQPRGMMRWLRSTAATDAFPKGYGPEDMDRPMLSAQAAYFSRVEQDRRHLIARNDAFPGGGSVEDNKPLPALVAYFERTEQQRLARSQPRQPVVARLESRSSQEAAQTGSAEITLAESSAIR